MKLPYGYVLINGEIVAHEGKADVVRSIFASYLAGASLGKIVDMLHVKAIPSPSGNPKWGRAAVDKLLSKEPLNKSPCASSRHKFPLICVRKT